MINWRSVWRLSPPLAIVTALEETSPGTKVLALVDDCQDPRLSELIEASLFGCLVKEESREQLVATIRGAVGGGGDGRSAPGAALPTRMW